MTRMLLFATLACLLAVGPVGCQDRLPSLQLDDLSRAERLYVERFVILERARAIALVDFDRGSALLDSLAAAWGDSSRETTRRALPESPARVAALHNLVVRILDAEKDSLVQAPFPRRLAAPLPDPAPAPAAE